MLEMSSKTNSIVNFYIVENFQNLKKKHTHTKRVFQCLYPPVILIDLIF